MPTPFTHAFVPIALGKTVTDKKMPLSFWGLAIFCSILPDADVIGFRFGIEYVHFLGHRGFSHSLLFAFIVSSAVVLLVFRKTGLFSKKWWLIWVFFFGVIASHGLLDAFTDGGLGIALFSPFDATRYFSPWRPLRVSPIGVTALFTSWGRAVLLSEIIWLWFPLTAALIITKSYRKIRKRAKPALRVDKK